MANGKTGATPEYPEGIYHYYATKDFPYLPRYLKGNADPSFHQGRGMMGPGGRGGQGPNSQNRFQGNQGGHGPNGQGGFQRGRHPQGNMPPMGPPPGAPRPPRGSY